LDAARKVSADSNGAFDVTVGPLLKLRGFVDRHPHVPTDAELLAVRPLIDYRNVLIDSRQHTVRFARARREFGLSGLVDASAAAHRYGRHLDPHALRPSTASE